MDEINFLITEIIERSERLKSNHTIILSSLQSQGDYYDVYNTGTLLMILRIMIHLLERLD